MSKHYFLIFFLFCLGIVTASAQYKILLNFDGINGFGPEGSLTLSGNVLYGMTEHGGANNDGCIFSIDTDGTNYKDLLDFNGTNGAEPLGSLTYASGILYGMTFGGGTNGYGVIFSLDTNGSGYKVLLNFNAAGPQNSLIISGSLLYGLAPGGGVSQSGILFSIDTDGSRFRDLFDFNEVDGFGIYNSLILWGNKLYGMTCQGGTSHYYGTIFSIDTNGSGYKDMLDFNDTNGAYPLDGLSLSDGVLYGMTSGGGQYGWGTIFSIDTNGGGYKILRNFSGTSGDGSNPLGSVTLLGNVLYGMTLGGGTNGDGTIFSIDTNGTIYNDLFDFNGTNGEEPWRNLTLSGCTLYGMTSAGGTNNSGVIFSFKLCDIDVTTKVNANILCNGSKDGSATITPSGGTSPYSYSWAPVGGTNSTASGLSAGTYTVTITDNNNNYAYSAIVTVTQPPVLNTTANVITNVNCYGGNNGGATVTLLSGAISPYTYSWSSIGGTNLAASNLSAGTYTVKVTDNNGCITTAAVTITQPAVLNTTDNVITNISCYEGNNGSALANASGGTSPYTYSWFPGSQANSMASGLTAGTYTVIITDVHGCTTTSADIVTITQPVSLIEGTPTLNQNVLCFGESNASATAAIPTGGISPYTYSWSSSGGTNLIASNLIAGTYTLIIIDSNGCTATSAAITITQPAPLNASGNVITNVSCYGGNNGSDSVSLNGGTTPYTYSWSGSSGTNATVKELSAGTYKVYITDANGCDTTTAVTITQPTPLTVTSGSGVLCNGDNTGTATVMPVGGVSPYTYSWLPTGGTSATGTGLSAEAYTITCTDSNGCVATGSVIIQQPLPPVINICCDSTIEPGQDVQLISSGGTSYLWNPSTGLSCDTCSNPIASPSQTITYTVTISDSGCISTRTITIDVGCGDVFVPTAFSPNEAHNNILYVRGTCIATIDFLVFDRWGNKVFESENLNSGWDGTYGGQPMNMATYVWYLKATLLDGTSVEKKGNVTLVR